MKTDGSRQGDGIPRIGGIAFGMGNQFLFLVTVVFLFLFLRNGAVNDNHRYWWLIDGALALQFAVFHSVMLVPRTRQYLARWVPASFYDSLFCTVTCLSLLAVFGLWRTSPTMIWDASPTVVPVIRGAFYFSWIALFYSLALTGLGYQNGWTPFYYWLRRRPMPRRDFRPRGAYKWIRHPVYLSFLGLIWFTPAMSLDHAVLTGIWTGYIFFGSHLKDERLKRFLGARYRNYGQQVPGFPLVSQGPLGRWKPEGVTPSMSSESPRSPEPILQAPTTLPTRANAKAA